VTEPATIINDLTQQNRDEWEVLERAPESNASFFESFSKAYE